MSHNVWCTADCVKELTKVRFVLETFGIVPIWLLVLYDFLSPYGYWCFMLVHMTFCFHMVIGTLCRYIWFLNVAMLFEFLMFIGIEFHSFAPSRHWVSFLSQLPIKMKGKMSPIIKTWSNGWSNFSEILRIIALKLLELTRFLKPNL